MQRLMILNALAVAACCLHCGLTAAQIQSAFSAFTGIRRRMEVKGEARGVTVVDDFGHHPTAIRETIGALRVRFPGRRLWVVFEPRSNTTRRSVFQHELAEALATADAAIVAQIARLELLAPADRLDPELLMQMIHSTGRPAHYLPDVPAIVAELVRSTKQGDVVCVFSNGGFDNIHEKALVALNG